MNLVIQTLSDGLVLGGIYALAAVVYWAISGHTPPASVGRMMSDSFVPLAQISGDGLAFATYRAMLTNPRYMSSLGATVLLSSHILSEVEQLCERVTIIRAGRTVESGTLTELRHLTRTSFRVTTSATAAVVSKLDGVHDLGTE